MHTPNVVNESMRLSHPWAFGACRRSRIAEWGLTTVPVGTHLHHEPVVLHRDPRYYEDAGFAGGGGTALPRDSPSTPTYLRRGPGSHCLSFAKMNRPFLRA